VMVVDARRTARAVAREALWDARIGPDRLAGVVFNRRPRALPRWLVGR